jgi:serine/threonine-protein phosphatase CPPED1
MERRYLILILLIVVMAVIGILVSVQPDDKIGEGSINWNYHQLDMFNHSFNNFTFTFSGDERDDGGNFSKMINSINNNTNILFNVNGGDLRSSADELNNFKKDYLIPGTVAHFNKPVIFVIGNHELVNNPTASIYRDIFGSPAYYNFTEGDSYFILIDNANGEQLNITQMSWLKNQLNTSQKYKYRFVFMHVPLYSPSGENEHSMTQTGADELRSLFDSSNVTMIFASHIHNYYSGTWGNTPYIISGGAGAPAEENHPPNHHYIMVNITEESVTYTTVQY